MLGRWARSAVLIAYIFFMPPLGGGVLFVNVLLVTPKADKCVQLGMSALCQ